ncbi:MAG: hypothetical protein WDW38_001342 [Sanguina aurantia]
MRRVAPAAPGSHLSEAASALRAPVVAKGKGKKAAVAATVVEMDAGSDDDDGQVAQAIADLMSHMQGFSKEMKYFRQEKDVADCKMSPEVEAVYWASEKHPHQLGKAILALAKAGCASGGPGIFVSIVDYIEFCAGKEVLKLDTQKWFEEETERRNKLEPKVAAGVVGQGGYGFAQGYAAMRRVAPAAPGSHLSEAASALRAPKVAKGKGKKAAVAATVVEMDAGSDDDGGRWHEAIADLMSHMRGFSKEMKYFRQEKDVADCKMSPRAMRRVAPAAPGSHLSEAASALRAPVVAKGKGKKAAVAATVVEMDAGSDDDDGQVAQAIADLMSHMQGFSKEMKYFRQEKDVADCKMSPEVEAVYWASEKHPHQLAATKVD